MPAGRDAGEAPPREGKRPTALEQTLAPLLGPGTVLLCVGNDLCGDDGAGPAVARALAGAVPWWVCDAGSAPENFLGKVLERRPDTVILVDAMDLGAEPGTVRVVGAEEIAGQGPGTHGPAPLAFLEALAMMHPCRRVVVGIQPGRTDPGSGLTPAVRRAVERLVAALRAAARGAPGGVGGGGLP